MPVPPTGNSNGSVTVGYFPNWAIYGRSYKPHNIPCSSLTHLLYCFADVKPDSGEVFLTDAWSDEQIHYDGDSWEEPGSNLYGNLKAIYKLKQHNRQMKVLLSIGGWTYSPHFAPMACDKSKRARFVASAVNLVKDYGFDGLDVDWEYPHDSRQADDYVALLRELREGLDGLQGHLRAQTPFELTIAAPCGMEQAKKLKIGEMDRYLCVRKARSR